MMRFIHRIAAFVGLSAATSAPMPSRDEPPTFDLSQMPRPMRKRGQGKSRNLKHAIRRKQIAAESRKRNWVM